MTATRTVTDEDGVVRCFWGAEPEIYRRYHDDEWGRPVCSDHGLLEKLCLEGFQSGLSWLTILRKRDAFRAAFADFDPVAVAGFDDTDVERLLSDAGIVRHRGKIESTINNARRAVELIEADGSLAAFVAGYRPDASARPSALTWDWLVQNSITAESTALAKDLKRRGWSYVGPTTVYAFMQAVGLVNDHLDTCSARAATQRAQREWDQY
jgi:DNA-3-methyladenine glycosylase I